MASEDSSSECTMVRGVGRHCMKHPRGAPNVDGKCCICGITRAELEPERLSLTTVCACSHVNNWHVRADHSDTHCAASDCPCGAFRASSEAEEPLPPCTCGPDEACGDPCDYESRCNGCGHHGGEGCGCPAHAFVSFEHCDRCAGTWLIKNAAEEPPLTPEEEEELPSPEGPEYTPCVCGHIEPEHDETGECWEGACGCVAYHTEPDDPPPPQPERRPPYAVSYSVQGHLFEVALSGDATVRAVDGALVIQHHLGPVAGIVSVLPVINKES